MSDLEMESGPSTWALWKLMEIMSVVRMDWDLIPGKGI